MLGMTLLTIHITVSNTIFNIRSSFDLFSFCWNVLFLCITWHIHISSPIWYWFPPHCWYDNKTVIYRYRQNINKFIFPETSTELPSYVSLYIWYYTLICDYSQYIFPLETSTWNSSYKPYIFHLFVIIFSLFPHSWEIDTKCIICTIYFPLICRYSWLMFPETPSNFRCSTYYKNIIELLCCMNANHLKIKLWHFVLLTVTKF